MKKTLHLSFEVGARRQSRRRRRGKHQLHSYMKLLIDTQNCDVSSTLR